MPHIHTEPGQYDITAGAYIIRLDGTEPKILLHNHIKLKKLMQYGGHIELDESPWQAVLREIREEAGYEPDQLQVLQPPQHLSDVGEGVTHPLPAHIGTYLYGGTTNHMHTDLAYVFVVSDAPRQAIAEGESASNAALTQKELEELSDKDVQHSVRAVGLFAFSLVGQWQAIPAGDYASQ